MAQDWEAELPALAELTDQEAADAINAMATTETYMRFGSFRTLASILTAEEYATVRTTLDTAAASNVMLADMVAMLKMPGDEGGNGGGIDFGNATVRTMLDSLCDASVAAKIKAHAERTTAKYQPITADAVGMARGTRARVQVEGAN